MKKLSFKILICVVFLSISACQSKSVSPSEGNMPEDVISTNLGDLVIHPIKHASLVLQLGKTVIYIDPVGGTESYEGLPRATMVLLTDTHPDHLNLDTLKAVMTDSTDMVIPESASEPISSYRQKMTILKNGEKSEMGEIVVEALPMYNLTEERLRFHPKGRGNGYLIILAGKRIYISGDTEDIPEMRQLKNIDLAFVCMNLPYTMDVMQAASAVLEFKPKVVYPYHYRGQDLALFKKIVRKNKNIEVRLRNWYR